jgi:hypothetical protein
MKRILLSGVLILLFAQVLFAQEKIEAPAWNVGDKWVFTQGMKMEVLEVVGNGYVVEFPSQTLVFDKSTLNKVSTAQGKRREPYRGDQKRLLAFPLTIGKTWKDTYSETLKWEDTHMGRYTGPSLGDETQIFENYKVLGWEEVEVRAGKFKVVKVEYKKGWSFPGTGMAEGKAWYWYSPEVKYVIQYQYDKNPMWSRFTNWELISFESIK